MENSEILTSSETTIRILFVVVYFVASLVVYRRLFPYLSPTSRYLASAILVAQVLLIAISLEIRPTSRFEEWFWNLDLEHNLQSTLASTQFALVGVFALLNAWLAQALPRLHRFYLAGIALVFFFLARDEFFQVHEAIRHWQAYYALLGAIVTVATVLVAVRSPRQSRKWHVCLLSGLAISATGAIAIEHLRYPEICYSLGFMPEVGRCKLYTVEECLEFLGIWLTLIAVLGLFSQSISRPHPALRRLLFFFPVFWILTLSPTALMAFLDFRLLHQPAEVAFQSGVKFHAYRIDRNEESFALQFFVSTTRLYDYAGLSYFVDLIDPVTGESIAGTDKPASRLHQWPIDFYVGTNNTYFWMYKQRIEVLIPSGIPSNRILWIVIALTRKDGDVFVPQKIVSRTNQRLFNKAKVVLGKLIIQAEPSNPSLIPSLQPKNRTNSNAAVMPKRADQFAWATEASVQFESSVRLQSFRLEIDRRTATIQLYTSARHSHYTGLGFSVRLIDQTSGESLANQDKWAVRHPYNWYYGLDSVPVYRHVMAVKFPPQIPTNRAHWVVLTLWRADDDAFTRQKIISSDLSLLNDTQVILDELVLPEDAMAPSSAPVAKFENGFALGAVDLPERAQAGEALAISFSWRADKEAPEDIVQFLHFVHLSSPREGAESVESGDWWGYDQQPLGPRLPTRLWYSGLADTETWQVALPGALAPGRYAVYTGLYRASDYARLQANDKDGAPFVDNSVPLGILIVDGD